MDGASTPEDEGRRSEVVDPHRSDRRVRRRSAQNNQLSVITGVPLESRPTEDQEEEVTQPELSLVHLEAGSAKRGAAGGQVSQQVEFRSS